VLEEYPSIPTQNDEYVFGVLLQLTVGTVHEPSAAVNEEPVTAYPLQFSLSTEPSGSVPTHLMGAC